MIWAGAARGDARRRLLARRAGAGRRRRARCARSRTSSSRRACRRVGGPARRPRAPVGRARGAAGGPDVGAAGRRPRRARPHARAAHARQARLRACCSSGLALVPTVLFPLLDVAVPLLAAVIGALLFAAAGWWYPDARGAARAPRPRGRAWAQALTVYVDIVGISLAGGAGVEDALMVAARAGSGPQFAAARRRPARRPDPPPQAVARPRRARRARRHPCRCGSWRRPSTWPPSPARGSARRCWPRPNALRVRQLTEAEAEAQKASETMGVAPALMAIAAVVLIGYPAVARFLSG